jgi:hypothetical protein
MAGVLVVPFVPAVRAVACVSVGSSAVTGGRFVLVAVVRVAG